MADKTVVMLSTSYEALERLLDLIRKRDPDFAAQLKEFKVRQFAELKIDENGFLEEASP